MQRNQVRNQHTLKIWKRVSCKGDEGTQPEANAQGLVGKRKAETEGPILEDQRQIKIRKWEDYLEDETETDFEEYETAVETENDLAEAATQPRPQQ